MINSFGREIMEKVTMPPLMAYFSELPDPRSNINKVYPLQVVVVITILAVMSFARGWEAIEEYAKMKKDWLAKFLPLENGVPGHDVYRRVFTCLDSKLVEKCFMAWVRDIKKKVDHEIIAIDGKSIRGTFNAATGKCIHVVSAWATTNKLIFGQTKVDEKSNEITAIPTLLDEIALSGAIITIDAMGCQYEIANKIIRRGGHYLFSLKGNQGNLHEDVEYYFKDLDFNKPAKEAGKITFKTTVTFDDGHGRHEMREIAVSDDVQWLHERHPNWKTIQSIGIVDRAVEKKGKVTVERRHFISSLPACPVIFATVVRAHWGIENTLHYSLDVAYREDACRVRKDNGPENLSIIRKISLTVARAGREPKRSLVGTIRMMAWSDKYMEQVLFNSDLS
jgi:predicted transposase YbfD/YdcC